MYSKVEVRRKVIEKEREGRNVRGRLAGKEM